MPSGCVVGGGGSGALVWSEAGHLVFVLRPLVKGSGADPAAVFALPGATGYEL